MTDMGDLPTERPSLIRAVYQSRLRLTRLLLEGGAYVNESNDRGETPLMIACRTKHVDAQSASKAKMVKYLLENKADPNIQDKSGKTALMHACLEKAGPEVVSLLLKSGADPSLQDHSNCSALVYAINSEEKETLQVLLNACKEQGKEVIIITTDKSGRHKTKQYLNMPPADLEECRSPTACTSPSEIELKTSSSPLSGSAETKKTVFSFQDLDNPRSVDNSSQTDSLTRKSCSTQVGCKCSAVKCLQSEPWVKSSPMLFHQSKIASLQQELQDITPEEELTFKINGLTWSKRFITRHQSIDIKDTAHLPKTFDNTGARKLSYDELNSNQASCVEEIPNPGGIPMGKNASLGQVSFISNLSSIIRRRDLGANHYSSDSQLTTSLSPAAAEDSKVVTVKKKILSPSHSFLPSSREAQENMPPVTLSRRNQAFLERQGSGALLDHIAQTRPGFLPPLNVNAHPPVQDVTFIKRVSGMISCGRKHLVPAAPTFPRETQMTKTLERRQSLQTEQIKQLVNF
ncbi:AN34B protein, partial [Rhinopomastus cyanomelas]|nr:AN34B protein [Rhinopomastus cyanomelas]